MKSSLYEEMPLGRIFGELTKKYVGMLSEQLKDCPTGRYFYPLYIIGKYSGKISQQELAEHLLTDKVSVVRIVDALEDRGLVERKTNPKDRRQYLLSITPKAKPYIKKIALNISQTNAVFLSGLKQENQICFKQDLATIAECTLNRPQGDLELFYKIKKSKNDQKT